MIAENRARDQQRSLEKPRQLDGVEMLEKIPVFSLSAVSIGSEINEEIISLSV